jgi:hypothetical protein
MWQRMPENGQNGLPQIDDKNRFTVYSSAMTSSHEWRTRSRCKSLSSQQADKLFFPGRGGSNKKAESFCSGCPVVGICLDYAIENDVDGFFAGTTKDQRRKMVPFKGIKVKKLETVLPNPPKKRRIFRKIIITSDAHEWLDTIPGPSEEELQPA